MAVAYEGVSKRFGALQILHELDLTIDDGEFVALLGPSGCGKTTTLRMLAGLERPTSGRILIDGRDVTGLPPKDRDVAMVFQNYALYPHLTIAANIGYPLKIRKVPKADREQVIARAASLLGIEDKLDCRPRELSGGQRQRVALARAIVRRPRVFLMDEPLSNLDAQLRVEMRGELKRLQVELGVTTVYVTHDQSEATTMADRVVVLNAGRVEQIAAPRTIYASPASKFVGRFVGDPPMSLLPAVLDGDRLLTEAGGRPLPFARSDVERLSAVAGSDRVTVGVRAEAVREAADDEPGIDAEVFAVQPLDHQALVTFRFDGDQLIGRLPIVHELRMGTATRITFGGPSVHVFHPDGQLLASLDEQDSVAGEQMPVAPTPEESRIDG